VLHRSLKLFLGQSRNTLNCLRYLGNVLAGSNLDSVSRQVIKIKQHLESSTSRKLFVQGIGSRLNLVSIRVSKGSVYKDRCRCNYTVVNQRLGDCRTAITRINGNFNRFGSGANKVLYLLGLVVLVIFDVAKKVGGKLPGTIQHTTNDDHRDQCSDESRAASFRCL